MSHLRQADRQTRQLDHGDLLQLTLSSLPGERGSTTLIPAPKNLERNLKILLKYFEHFSNKTVLCYSAT